MKYVLEFLLFCTYGFFLKKKAKKKIQSNLNESKLILFVQKLASEDGFQEGKQIFIFSIGKLQKKF